MAVKVKDDACTGCGACVESCPSDAIIVDEKAKVNEEACIDCGACVDECPAEALSLD